MPPLLGAIGTPQVGTFTERTAETSTAVPYPATVPANSLLVLAGSVFNLNLVTSPAGWTQVANFSATGNTQTPDIYMGIKVAAGTEGGGTVSVTHNNNVSAWQILAFPGVDIGTPQDVAATTFDGGAGTSTTPLPAVTTTRVGVALVYAAANLNTANTATAPVINFATMTETGDRSTGTRDFTMGYVIWDFSGDTGTATVNWTSAARSVGVMLALRPAKVAPRSIVPAQQAVPRSFGW